MPEGRLVWSSDEGDRRERDRRPRRAPEAAPGPRLPDDGVVRVFRERGGRGGKVVTVVRGLERAALQDVAADLKRHLGTGGAVRADAVELQGDHRERVVARLEASGRRVKLAGG